MIRKRRGRGPCGDAIATARTQDAARMLAAQGGVVNNRCPAPTVAPGHTQSKKEGMGALITAPRQAKALGACDTRII